MVFEFGMGGSTVWFAKLRCSIFSVEMVEEWIDRVKERLIQENLFYGKGGRLVHTPSLEEHADWMVSAYPDDYFDIILIDGRNRNRCLGNVRSKVKAGGIVVLDNSERTEYADGVALYDGWEKCEWGDEGWMTTVWIRPDKVFERVELPHAEA